MTKWCFNFKSSSKLSESTQKWRIWEPLGFADIIREASKSYRNLVLQRGDHMSHVVHPLILGQISICGYPANRVANNRDQRQTGRFGSLWPFLTWSGKFRRVAEASFCKGWTTWLMWSTLWYKAEFRRVDISCKSIAKQSESTPNSGIWWPLAFPDIIREVSKSYRNLDLQKGDHMAYVVSYLLLGRNLTYAFVWQIECQTIGINAKQQDLEASGPSWHDQGSFEELEKLRFAKGDHMSHKKLICRNGGA